jgi:hypothetical protein
MRVDCTFTGSFEGTLPTAATPYAFDSPPEMRFLICLAISTEGLRLKDKK